MTDQTTNDGNTDNMGASLTDTPAPSADKLKDGVNSFAKQAADKAREFADEGKTRAGSALDEVARMMGSAATTVDERLGENYGKYARSAADGLSSFSEKLKGADVEELFEQAQAYVRKSPAVAIGVAAALGFVVARLVRAGSDGEAPRDTGIDETADA